MKLVIRTVLFHIICITVFSFVYFYLKEDFHSNTIEHISVLDVIVLSTTIQSTVGLTNIRPMSPATKLAITAQQIVMIMVNVFTVYIFTI
jgi:hypothetical protein